MAQQGAGNSGWPMHYDDGSGFGLQPSAEDINNFLDMSSLPQHHLDVWPPAQASNAAPDFGQQPHQNADYSISGHHQVAPEYVHLINGQLGQANTDVASVQQGWSSYQIPQQSDPSPGPVFAASAHNTPHSFDASSAAQSFAGSLPRPFGGNHGLSSANSAMAGVQYIPEQMDNHAQWQQQQSQQQQSQNLSPQQPQKLQPQHQQHFQQHGAMQNPSELPNFAVSGQGAQSRPAVAPRPSHSPMPRQATATPDGSRQHTNSPAGTGYQTHAQSWHGQVGGQGGSLAPSQHAQPIQHQPQQQFEDVLQGQPQIQHFSQPHQMLLPQNLTPPSQSLQMTQPQPAMHPMQESTPPSAPSQPTAVTKPPKATKAPKPTKAKPKVSKAKQTAQPVQTPQQPQQPSHEHPGQLGQVFQQHVYPFPQQIPQQIQSSPPVTQQANTLHHPASDAAGYGQPAAHEQGQIPAANGWQQQSDRPMPIPAEAQFDGHLHSGQYQHNPNGNTMTAPQTWPDQQHRVLQQGQPPSQQSQQSQLQQLQQLEHQHYLQQLQQKQQQQIQPKTGSAAAPIQPLQQSPAPHTMQQHRGKPERAVDEGAPNSGNSSSQPPAPGPSPMPISVAPKPRPSSSIPQTHLSVLQVQPAGAPPGRPRATKSALKKTSPVDIPPRPIPHLVSAADTIERQQLFPGVPFLALGNVIEIEPPLTTGEPAVQPDPSKELGKKHFPGRKGSLPCEIIAEYDRLVSSQPPERKEALINELRSKLKSLGKILPPKVYKFASLGDQSKKTAKTAVRGPVAMDSPDSADEDEEEEEVRSATRPEDPADAAAWDAIGHVHVENSGPTTIKRAVKNFGDFIKGLYDGVKESKEKLKKAEETGAKKDAIEQLKKALAFKHELLYRAVDAADEKGHEQVLENLGGNGPLVANLVSALRDCVNAADFNGKLPKTLLRFMSQFTTVTDEMLNQKLKFDKIQKRFMAKGDDEVKGLVGEIVSKTLHAKPATSAPMTASGTGSSAQGVTRTAKPATRVPSDSLSSKRPREEEPDSRSAKKIATPSASGAPQPIVKPTTTAGATPGTSASVKPWAGTALLPGKSRPVAKAQAAKPDAAKAEVSSAARKTDVSASEAGKPSGTGSPSKRDAAAADVTKTGDALGNAAALAAAATAAKAKKSATVKADIGSSLASQSKLGALLDEISKPKSATPAAPTPDSSSESVSSSETPEEKAKRLRKESRRKLRVTWKSGDELTEVRIFTKDKDEDEGRANYLLRDANDDRSEGLALKRSLKKGVNFEDEDEDGVHGNGEDEEDELPYRPWFEPSMIDFSPLGDKRNETFTTRGGTIVVDTPEQRAMAERENTVLMAIYTDPSDIPPTPKSPILGHGEQSSSQPASGGPQGIMLPTNDAKFHELQVRWNEERTMGARWAVWNAVKRIDAVKQQQAQSRANAATATTYDPTAPAIAGMGVTANMTNTFTGPRADEVVRLLNSDTIKGWKTTLDLSKVQKRPWQDYTDPAVQKAVIALEALVDYLKSKPFPATEPPEYITDAERIKEWWTGYNRDRQRERTQAEVETQQLAALADTQQAGPANQQHDAAAAWAAHYAQFNPQLQQQPQQPAQPAAENAYAQYMNMYYQQQQQQAGTNSTGDTNTQLQALLATLGGPAQATQLAAAPQNDAQVQAILASMAGGNTQQAAAQFASNAADPNQAYMLSLAQWVANQQQAKPEQLGSAGTSGGKTSGPTSSGSAYKPHQQESHRPGVGGGPHGRGKRDRDRDRDQDSSIPSHLRGINRALINTKACVFWASGKCAKGDKCTFRHD